MKRDAENAIRAGLANARIFQSWRSGQGATIPACFFYFEKKHLIGVHMSVYVLRDPEESEIQYLDRLGNLKGMRVLEIGSGDGRMTKRYAAMARSVVGIDPDLESLAIAAKSQPDSSLSDVNLALALAQALPFPDEHFDRVIMAWSL